MFPVKKQGCWHYQQTGTASFFLMLCKNKSKDLQRFSKSHIVGQASAETQLIQKVKPCEPVTLIIPKRGFQFSGKRNRLNPVCFIKAGRSEEHKTEIQTLMSNSSDVFSLKKK